MHSTEMERVAQGPIMVDETTTVLAAGICEVLLGLCVVVFWNQSWPVFSSLLGFAALLIGAMAISPELAIHAFNPVTLSVSAIIFCLIQMREKKIIDRAM